MLKQQQDLGRSFGTRKNAFKPPVTLAALCSKAVFLLLIVATIVEFRSCMFCCTLLCVHSSFAIISMGKSELVALLCLISWCLMIVVWVCLQFVIEVFPNLTPLLLKRGIVN